MRNPDMQSSDSMAWNLRNYIRKAVAKNLESGKETSIVTSWLLFAPWAHPVWDYYVLSITHLRPAVGTMPAKKLHPEAEFELVVAALDPKSTPDPDVCGFTCLCPIKLIVQFKGVEQDFLLNLAENAARSVLDRNISPDSDFIEHWRLAINNAVIHHRGKNGPIRRKDVVLN